MGKVDLKKQDRVLYSSLAGEFEDIAVPEMTFVKVDGAGNPNTSPAYSTALKAIYSVSYALKFAAKTDLDQDYVVPPLEGLWWAKDPNAFAERRKDEWLWTMMIRVPDFVERELHHAALEKAAHKLGALPTTLRIETLDEGRVLQTLHVGSYDDEGPILAHLHHELMPAMGLTFDGPHHEIYLGDPRRTAPDKLKTILRQPVRPLEP